MSFRAVRTSEGQDLEVVLSLRSPDQVFDLRDPAPFREKDLDDDFARYLLVAMEEEPESKNVQLKIQIPIGSLSHFSQNDIEQAIRDYYSFEVQSLTGEIRSILSEGRWGLLLGMSFLIACQFGAYLLVSHEGFVASTVKQGIEILGWVALWNPINHLLYEWWPVLQKRQLVEKLSKITVCVEALPTPS